ncbi:hypothetical protein O3P69_000805 [Scylla paramamosain]|uniref:Uncharacterized protein n=1 Tax=Scylla paramamosain TaxID=85552 RepID=A0AAW0UVY0_SCYPA
MTSPNWSAGWKVGTADDALTRQRAEQGRLVQAGGRISGACLSVLSVWEICGETGSGRQYLAWPAAAPVTVALPLAPTRAWCRPSSRPLNPKHTISREFIFFNFLTGAFSKKAK